jgi:adenylate cyclase
MAQIMETTGLTRKLAAILIADVAGYTRHMEIDDAGTYAQLKEIRQQLIVPMIVEHGGHVVGTVGDGMLAEFNSAVEALRAAIDVQRALAVRNHLLPSDRRTELRIGICLADVIVDGNEIAGDGVNVAARLEALAEPGGICVSGSVHEQVHGSLDVGFIDIGKQHVKNIERPIRVLRVDLQGAGRYISTPVRRLWLRLAQPVGWRWLASAVFAAAVVIVGITSWPKFREAAPDVARPPLSIAILPFIAPGGDAAENEFADGITQDLTISLGRTHVARLVSYSVASTFRGRGIDARAVGGELKVRYLVLGEVRHVGEQIVISTQFVDAIGGTQVWSERMELERARVGQDRDRLIAQLTGRLRDALADAEQRRAGAALPTGSSAMDLAIHAEAVWRRDPNTIKGALAAREIFDQALKIDPGLMRALLGRARTLAYELDLNPHAARDQLLPQMDVLSSRAVTIDAQSPLAWQYRAEALSRQWRWEAALEANDKARRLDPMLGSPISQRAAIMINPGKPAVALALLDQALALDPQHPATSGWPMLERCIALMNLDKYADATAACEKSVAKDDWWLAHLYLVAAYQHMGDAPNAAAEKATLLKQQPGFKIADFKAMGFSDSPIYWRQTETYLLADLRKAGIPDK